MPIVVTARSQFQNIQDQRPATVAITSPNINITGGSGINLISLKEMPSNLSGDGFAVSSVNHPGTYTYTQVTAQPTAAGQYLVDWNSDRIYLYAQAGDDIIQVAYAGKGNVPHSMDVKLTYMVQQLAIYYMGTPQPVDDVTGVPTILGTRYSWLDTLAEAAVTNNYADITGFQIEANRPPSDAALGLTIQTEDVNGVVGTSLDIANLLAINARKRVYKASSANYLLRLTTTYCYWTVKCLGSSTASGASGIHIIPNFIAVP